MTRDEHRAKCIEAMVAARLEYHRSAIGLELPSGADAENFYTEMERRLMTVSFDALRTAGVGVYPIEATEEMRIAAVRNSPTHGPLYDRDIPALWAAMSATGDLTNPPKTRPATIENVIDGIIKPFTERMP